jgi:hypothetical protein
MVLAVLAAACSALTGETPTDSSNTSATTGDQQTTPTSERDCIRLTGGTNSVDTGDVETDALFLSGELFLCADDVVVVGTNNLNEVAVGAQLAAALGGPLLYDHPQVASEVGRLKPYRLHLIGSVDVLAPTDTDVLTHDMSGAVEETKTALGVSEEIILPAIPDATTVVETVLAIMDRDRVVVPLITPGTTSAGNPAIDTGAVINGLAVPSRASSIWIVDGGDPVTILLSAATGRAINAGSVAIDGDDVLGYPEVGVAIAGYDPGEIRFVGHVPETDEWSLQVLANGQQVPGGGFHILPEDQKRRYVAFYGHPETSALGVLGEQGPEDTLIRMEPYLDAYSSDGSQVVPVFEMIASVAAAQLTEDDDRSFEWPIETFNEYLAVAEANDAYIVLDLQSGYDHFLTQAKQYEELLRLPFVGLALDPEWRLEPGQVHLQQVGHADAAEINEVIHWLADLVRDNGLPQKMIMVHQFRPFMIENRETLEERPELQLIIQMDGDGTEPQKDNTYAILTEGTEDAFWSWGWKNFFDEDEPGPPTPDSTMSKDPSPVYVSYQ